MKKGLFVGLTIIGISTIGIMSVKALTNCDNKVDILSKLTGKSNEEIIEEKINEGKTLSDIAEESNVFNEFKSQTNNRKYGKQKHRNCKLNMN